MSNHIKKSEREVIYQYAEGIVTLEDGYGRVVNYPQALDNIMSKFSISQQRALAAIAHAARKQRAAHQ